MRDCTEEESEYLKRYAEQERNVTGPRRSVHLWEFLLELLMDDSSSTMIQWTDEMNGEFKLKNSEDVARKWGQRKHKEGMNYDKLSRALRYYYSKEIIKKVSGRRFVYKFVPSPEIYAAVNAIKAHMIRNGAQQIPLGPFPHYRQAENMPTSQDTKPFMFYPHIRARSISPRLESEMYPQQPSPPRSRSPPNGFRTTEDVYKSDSHILLSHSYKNDELVRKMKYFKQEEARYAAAPMSHFQRRHHSETTFRQDDVRAHQRLTPPLDSPRREHPLPKPYYSPTYDYENNNSPQERKPPVSSISLSNTNTVATNDKSPRPDTYGEFIRRPANGVGRENGHHELERKSLPSAFMSLESRAHESRGLHKPYESRDPQVKHESPAAGGYCKDCPSCNLQPSSVSECDRKPSRWYDSNPPTTNGLPESHRHESHRHESHRQPLHPKDDQYYRRHLDSASSDDVFYSRKYSPPMVDACTQTDSDRSTSPPTHARSGSYYDVRAWMDLNTDSRRTNGHIIKPTPLSQYKDVNNDTSTSNGVHDVDENNNNIVNVSDVVKQEKNNGDASPTPDVVTNGKRKVFSPDNVGDNASRRSTPSSIISPVTPHVPQPPPSAASAGAGALCKCGCMDSAGSPAMPGTNGNTVVVYQKEVV